jgi:glyoxylase-like metal-dependent hydrolase (beta-lactamase superfamily II)
MHSHLDETDDPIIPGMRSPDAIGQGAVRHPGRIGHQPSSREDVMKSITIAAFAGTVLLFAGAAYAQAPDFSRVEIKTTDLGNKTYMLEGQGGNITVAVGTDGIIMVDSQYAPLHDKIKAAIAKISPLPIKYLIDTHYHLDHVSGNAAFHKEGATIVAHDNVRIRLAAGTTDAVTGNKTPPAESEAIPTETYMVGEKKLEVGGRVALLKHVYDGDTWVTFPDANVLVTGDILHRTSYPNLDWGQRRHHRRDDPGARDLPQGGERQYQDRARPWSARYQGQPAGIP